MKISTTLIDPNSKHEFVLNFPLSRISRDLTKLNVSLEGFDGHIQVASTTALLVFIKVLMTRMELCILASSYLNLIWILRNIQSSDMTLPCHAENLQLKNPIMRLMILRKLIQLQLEMRMSVSPSLTLTLMMKTSITILVSMETA